MENQHPSRRNFLKNLCLIAGAGILAKTLSPQSAQAQTEELKTIDMSEKKRTDAANKESVGLARGLGYVENLEKGLKEKKIAKTDRPVGAKVWKANEQTCDNCMFYNYKKENPPKATCQLMSKILVHPKGSCNSWQAKA